MLVDTILLLGSLGAAGISFNLGLGTGAGLGGGVGKGLSRDRREILATGAAEFRITAAAGAQVITDGGAIDALNVPAAAEENVPFASVPMPLPPDSRLTVAARSAAVATAVIFLYRERPAELSELPT
jgi:hypothetical protein